MMPFNLTFRRLLVKFIPQVKKEDIDRHESLLALRHQLYQELVFAPPEEDEEEKKKSGRQKSGPPESSGTGNSSKNPPGKVYQDPGEEYRERVRKQIDQVSGKAAAIFRGYEKVYSAVQRLWTARRKFAIEQGNLLQIPSSLESLGRFISTAVNYYITVILTFPTLQWNRLKFFITKLVNEPVRILVIVVLTVLIVWGVNAVTRPPQEEPQPPQPPVVSDIPDQKITPGKNFDPVILDNFVDDPDTPDSLITWMPSGDSILQVVLENRIASISPPDSPWTGSETIIFTATDPDSGSDSDSARYTVAVDTMAAQPDTSQASGE